MRYRLSHSPWYKNSVRSGGEDYPAELPPLSIERSAALAECDRLQPGQSLTAAGAAEENRPRLAQQIAAAPGENRRTFNQACPILLAAAGREPSDAEVLWKHAAENRGATIASGIGEP